MQPSPQLPLALQSLLHSPLLAGWALQRLGVLVRQAAALSCGLSRLMHGGWTPRLLAAVQQADGRQQAWAGLHGRLCCGGAASGCKE